MNQGRRLTSAFAARFLAALIVVLLLAACQTDAPADPCSSEAVLFGDEFEDATACGWTLYNDSGLTAAIADGALRISISQSGKIAWTNAGRSFTNTIINVRARQISGPNDNAYGVICRYQNAENFYVFLISGDGYFAIGKYETGRSQIRYLTGEGEGQYVYSGVINQGVATNDVRASCIGDQLSLAVNGIPLATVTDNGFSSGDIGLGASTLEPGTAVIEFDNVQVLAP